MIIENAKLVCVMVDRINTYKTGFGSISKKVSIIVALTSNNKIGFGEVPIIFEPYYVSEYYETSLDVLRRHFLPILSKSEFFSVQEILTKLKVIKGWNIARYGVETALIDLWCKIHEQTHWDFWEPFGIHRKHVAVGETLGLDMIHNTLNKAAILLDNGCSRIKLKISPKQDIVLLDAFKNEFGEKITLQVDANQSYDHTDIAWLTQLDRYNLVMIEQPFKARDIVSHIRLQGMIETPVCLDESIESIHDASLVIQSKACRIINIKPPRVGGLFSALEINELCQSAGIQTWIGGMGEFSLGKFYNLIACCFKGISYPTDCASPSEIYRFDIPENQINYSSTIIPPDKLTIDQASLFNNNEVIEVV